MSEPWTGAWRWISDRMDGRPTVTSTRYCYMSVMKNRVPASSEPLSDADAAVLFRGIGGAGGGTIETTARGDEQEQVHTNYVGSTPEVAASSVLRTFQVSGEDMRQQVLGPDREVLADYGYVRISDAGSAELAGAWELRADEWSGLVIFTDSQYQYLTTRDDRPTGTSRESGDAELAELYRSMFAQAGAYTVSGDSLLVTPDVVMNPADRGREFSIPFKLGTGELELNIGGRTWTLEQV